MKHNASVLLAQHGNEPTPAYSLRHPDPSLPASKNRYAVALYDSYCPGILYGEVLLIPEWTQPTLSNEEIRRNGGVPPPPQPVLPTSFTIQLYNPDQQIKVELKTGSWGGSDSWTFEMPQQSFRQPSNSSIDRTQSDPTYSDITPKVNFRWKREGRFSPDYICSIVGKSTNPDGSKRKHREPDITTALFKNLREITLYEPNLARAEMEDSKGLEVVLLLGAIVLREVYHSTLQETFNVSEGASHSTSIRPIVTDLGVSHPPPHPGRSQNAHLRPSSRQHQRPSAIESTQRLPLESTAQRPITPDTRFRPPPTDPRSQWELDREAALLKKQVEKEEHDRRKAERAETKRIKKMLEEEEREWTEKERRRKAAIDRETERLKREFEHEQRRLGGPQRPHSAQPLGASSSGHHHSRPQQGAYLYPPPQPGGASMRPEATTRKKHSLWGLRGGGEIEGNKRPPQKQHAVF